MVMLGVQISCDGKLDCVENYMKILSKVKLGCATLFGKVLIINALKGSLSIIYIEYRQC